MVAYSQFFPGSACFTLTPGAFMTILFVSGRRVSSSSEYPMFQYRSQIDLDPAERVVAAACWDLWKACNLSTYVGMIIDDEMAPTDGLADIT